MQLKEKTILVTGGAGYLGSVLVDELLRKGCKVRVLDFLMFGDESLASYKKNPYFELIVGDIRDKDKVKESLKGAWAVCHLASLVGEPACVVNPAASREINVKGTKLLVTEAKKAGVERFIFPSTCSIYGKTNTNRAVDEKFKTNPLSIYAETKKEAEKVVLEGASSKFCPTIFRFGTCFGLSPKMRFNLLINQLTRDLALGKPIEIYKPSAWRPFIHVRDAADLFINVFEEENNKVCGQIFNAVGENLRRADIVKILRKHFPEADIKIVKLEKDAVKRDYRVNAEKIKKLVGFAPKRRVEDEILQIAKAVKERFFKKPYHWKYNAWVRESML